MAQMIRSTSGSSKLFVLLTHLLGYSYVLGMEATRQIRESERLIRTGRYNDAISLLTEILEDDPLFLPALLNIGIAYTESGRNAEAVDALRFYLKHDEENSEAWEAIGCALLRQKEFDEAEACFKRAIDIAPENASVLRNYSVLLSQTERGGESYRLLRKSHALDPDDFLTKFALAASYRYLGRNSEALALYEELNATPNVPERVQSDIEQNIVELTIGW